MISFERVTPRAGRGAGPGERVLLAEEDDELRAELAQGLRSEGFVVIEVEDGLELEDYLESARTRGSIAPPDVVVSEATMAGCGGLEALAHLRGADVLTPFILLNPARDPEVHARALRLAATCVLDGPVNPEHLRRAVMRAAERR